MRLIVCKLCSGNEPFACPARFRRTYMQLHLEKSHALVPKELRIIRVKSQRKDRIAEWVSAVDDNKKLILVEMDVALKGGSEVVQAGGTAQADKAVSRGQANWTAPAMQQLHRDRQGQVSPF